MIEHLPEQIEAWHEFYVMLGSGAAALTGLLFVIASLGPHVMANHTETGVKAFISPIAVHFTSALVASALMLAAGVPSGALGALLSLGGLGGIIYTAWTRAHEQWRRNKPPGPGLDLVRWTALLGVRAHPRLRHCRSHARNAWLTWCRTGDNAADCRRHPQRVGCRTLGGTTAAWSR
jgi:hypothetical protein